MAKKTLPSISPKLKEAEKAALIKGLQWRSLNAAATFWLRAAPRLYNLALLEAKARLSAHHLVFLRQACHGHMPVPRTVGRQLAGLVEEAGQERNDARHRSFVEGLQERLEGLSSEQLAALEIWASLSEPEG
jgi:hypothetical protein